MAEPHNSANITSFFGTDPVRVISDPEGYHVCQLAHEINKDGAPDNNMLVLGDLMDYTLGGGDNGNNFAVSALTKLRESKSNSFASVKYCLEHKEKVKVLFGNRDLNKLKLLPLGLITDSSGRYVKWWESGKTYLDAANGLIEMLDGEHKWAVPSMKNWEPFWNTKRLDYWKYDNPRLVKTTEKMSCLERYYLIFGLDGTHGTISAQNTLFGVAQECGKDVYNSIFGKHIGLFDGLTGTKPPEKTNYLLDIANQPDNTEFKKDCELAAALVFTVFMDALYGTAEPSNDKPFTGVFHKFFNSVNTYFCAYAELSDATQMNLLTFSHGGMREDFFKNCKLNENAAEYFAEDEQLKNAYQLGGYLGNTATELESKIIKDQINEYNTSLKATLAKAIKFYHDELNSSTSNNLDKPTAELLVNLVVSVPHLSGDGCMNISSSPIMPGIDSLNKLLGYRNMPIVAKDAKLYQFIGHGPMGFAPTIDKYLSTNGKASYLINLDISNSLFGQFGHLSPENIANNYSYIEVLYKNSTLTAKSFVNVILNGYEINVMESGKETHKETLKELKINGFNLLTLLSGKDNTEFFKSDKRTNYHGKIDIKGTKYDLFTTADSGPPFTVYLHAIKSYLQGGKTMRRRHQKAKHTGKHQPMKLYVRRSHTLVRRKPNMKRTAKKL